MSHHAYGSNFDFERGDDRSMLDVVTSRQQFLIVTAGGAAAISLPMVAVAAETEKESKNPNEIKRRKIYE